MTKIILSGACGKMGKVIQSVVAGRDDCKIVAGVDKYNDNERPFLFMLLCKRLRKVLMLLLTFQIRHFLTVCLNTVLKQTPHL